MKKYAIMCLNNFLCINIQEEYPYPFLTSDGSKMKFEEDLDFKHSEIREELKKVVAFI